MSRKSEKTIHDLQQLLGEASVKFDAGSLENRANDTWPLRLVQKTVGGRLPGPLCVVKPQNTAEVAKVLAYLNEQGITTVPFGGGSGVGGGAEPTKESVIIDVGTMNQIIELNEENLYVTTQPAVILGDLEKFLNEKGYTTGHYPQSINLAQMGGLVATRSSGQFSTKYGNIEDVLLGLEAVLPNGEIIRIKNIPRRSVGPDLRHIWLGSEGIFGIITEVSVKIFPTPQERWMQAYAIPNMRQGLGIIQSFVREGWQPAVVRLHDDKETAQKYASYVHEGESVLLILTEGPKGLAQAEGNGVDAIVQAMGGRPLGEDPVQEWLGHRNDVKLEKYTSQGIIVDTIEISAMWSDIAAIYEKVTERLTKEVPELLLITGHSSHSYKQGTNIYFIFGAQPEQNPDKVEQLYWTIWSKVMETTLEHGGSICHHHGIGKGRAQWVPDELGSSYSLLKKLKEVLDPNGVMNQGTLMPATINKPLELT
ncbi:FAD-binding oxidoreductase [Paenibacillus herberti]|uniref:FAD-binding oxidoreductase n=1 Tax=Paenibacillus herberti TaxID=1619309 RepID=A0A229P1F5_9BACL|nr:FAD-binding oxidoreductase [Paenibacillus herberti]OXM15729.1 FAD-binding oxidoreductase [Paenibacillus herberti]